MAVNVLTAKEAVDLIEDNDVVVTGGFVGLGGVPEEIELELENKFFGKTEAK